MELFSGNGYSSIFSFSSYNSYRGNNSRICSTNNRFFGRVEVQQYLVKSWSTIVELISVWKRLREFEINLEKSIAEEIKT